MKTILITGSSSGYGLETARHFLARDWNVVATMRTPRLDLFDTSDRLRVLALDVTDVDSIALAIELAGPIDVLVNNAGIGLFGALEHSPMAKIRDVYATNTLGTIAMTQAVIPQMRERGSGTIINVTSSATLAPFPLAAAYTGSKTAIQGFTGSLAHELAPLGMSVKLVEPGYGPTTAFAANTDIKLEDVLPEPYGSYAAPILAGMAEPALFTTEGDVAEAVWAAVHDTSGRSHFPAGADALALVAA
ncbi:MULTISPECIES: SDR family oxidoreductase [unclassified Sphingopyxis]|uniref:SDR family oxidoreductase n=1 Tax=unclassified Sphingopyxis TaxID=2614943 RepID=UPI0007314684|nr:MULTISPECIES: SDR family oxidoreductase [unclassified Sphingopyxis]KTE27869.1 dehydrogenase [Sphingopyxis sp. H057]KTE55751.1 dehydrogenase [Sphingopyxis sp. H073]KTE57368.1 dehydrogenase [Sphingopyxis sp. H071]KTE61455.1 dehydrogenase [Sphingopyxis sp. H107]KTE65214.1 dehydrogenase [Sphingopyxis sp. H100]